MPEEKVIFVCPECGVNLEGLDINGHSLTHFPDYLDPVKAGKEARKRQKLLLDGGVTIEQYDILHLEV